MTDQAIYYISSASGVVGVALAFAWVITVAIKHR